MHELSIAHGIFEIVAEHVPRDRAGRVREVRVRVGDASGVLADSLEFCFDAIVSGTPWAGARLEIERVQPIARCWSCEREFPTGDLVARCPVCRSDGASLVAGRDLQVLDIEVVDADEPAVEERVS